MANKPYKVLVSSALLTVVACFWCMFNWKQNDWRGNVFLIWIGKVKPGMEVLYWQFSLHQFLFSLPEEKVTCIYCIYKEYIQIAAFVWCTGWCMMAKSVHTQTYAIHTYPPTHTTHIHTRAHSQSNAQSLMEWVDTVPTAIGVMGSSFEYWGSNRPGVPSPSLSL